jgi:hypothetical protein
MKLTEFYNPESDQETVVKRDDTRKSRLTLRALNKLRCIKNIKRAEEIDHMKAVSRMYGSAEDDSSPF